MAGIPATLPMPTRDPRTPTPLTNVMGGRARDPARPVANQDGPAAL